ncbi:MAG: sigma-70 family RNA polymerase sigma factor [Verrucomicrobia bacterium]|nr:sigma-70 family RNA polymerase sigma factor [Verrucomicrobiota bacterium]
MIPEEPNPLDEAQGPRSQEEMLLSQAYQDLRRIAAHKLASEPSGITLQATALVHEAWLKLMASGRHNHWADKSHFVATAAEAMRRILIDRARRRSRVRHGGDLERCHDPAAVDAVPAPETSGEDLQFIHDKLAALEALDVRKGKLVKMHMLAGLELKECARLLGISEPTAKRDWAFSRAWLLRELKKDDP